MTKNITRVDALNTAIEALSDNTTVVEVLTAIRDSIVKANSRRSDKPTKAQVEAAALRAKVVHVAGLRRHEQSEDVRPA